METGCYAVNKNDYLNKVYIYNAGAFKQSDSYTVTGTKTDATTEEVGTAAYDSKTDRIVFTPTKDLCISMYSQLAFAKKA